MRGEHRKIRQENELDAWQAQIRDQRQMNELVFRDLEDRRALKRSQSVERSALKDERAALEQDRQQFKDLRSQALKNPRDGPGFER